MEEIDLNLETARLTPDVVKRRNVALLLAAVALVGLHIGIFESTFNNYLDAVHHLDASSRGILEFPRELPGFLVALLSGLLFLLPDSRAAAVAMAALAAGLFGLGFFSGTFGSMIAWMMLWSAGHHLFMPLEQSLAVSLADKGQMGKRLGQVAAASTVATIGGAAIVWIGVDFFDISFGTLFAIGPSPRRPRVSSGTSRTARPTNRRLARFAAVFLCVRSMGSSTRCASSLALVSRCLSRSLRGCSSKSLASLRPPSPSCGLSHLC